MTIEEVGCLLHMTGLYRSKTAYRNHFATDEGTPDWPADM